MSLDRITYIKSILELYDKHDEIYNYIVPSAEQLMSMDSNDLIRKKELFNNGAYERGNLRKTIEASLADQDMDMLEAIYKNFLELSRYDKLNNWLSTPLHVTVIEEKENKPT